MIPVQPASYRQASYLGLVGLLKTGIVQLNFTFIIVNDKTSEPKNLSFYVFASQSLEYK